MELLSPASLLFCLSDLSFARSFLRRAFSRKRLFLSSRFWRRSILSVSRTRVLTSLPKKPGSLSGDNSEDSSVSVRTVSPAALRFDRASLAFFRSFLRLAFSCPLSFLLCCSCWAFALSHSRALELNNPEKKPGALSVDNSEETASLSSSASCSPAALAAARSARIFSLSFLRRALSALRCFFSFSRSFLFRASRRRA